MGTHGGHDMAGHTMPMSGPMSGLSMTAMNAHMLAELRPLSGRAFDVRWAQLMTVHHRMAVDMARAELQQGRDPRVQALARQIIAEQSAELTRMAGWLRTWGAEGTAMPLPHMMPPAAGDTDRWFLTEMIPHHQGAVDMARLVPARAQSAEVRALAAGIARSQSAEIAQFRALLGQRP
jgi:uncharacterized protein (DUF305 family)